ncbi:MAG: hypothetical protein WC750_03965 [Patescibacteria group bacterium]|jgi:hypothetical protein
MAEEKNQNAPSNSGLVNNQSQALDQVANLVTNYNSSNEANRVDTVEAFKNNLFKLDRGVVKKMFDSASAIRNKPDLTFIIQELPGLYIPKKIFTEDLKTPARSFFADYDRRNYQDLQVKSQAEASAKSEGSSTKLDAAKAAVLGKGFGAIGQTLGSMAGLKPVSRRTRASAGGTKETTPAPQKKTLSSPAALRGHAPSGAGRSPEISNVPIAAPAKSAAAPQQQATGAAPAAPGVELKAEGEIKNEAEVQAPNLPAPPSPTASGGKGTPQTAQIEAKGETETRIKIPIPTAGGQTGAIFKEISIQAPAESEVSLPPPLSPISSVSPARQTPIQPRRSRLGTYGRQPARGSAARTTPSPQNLVGTRPGPDQATRIPVLPSRQGGAGTEISRPDTRRTTEVEQAPSPGGRAQAQTTGQDLAIPSTQTEQPMSAASAFGARGTPNLPTTKSPSSQVSVVPGTWDAGTLGRPGRRSSKSVGPQEIKPPISRAMDLHAAQNEAWRGRAMERGDEEAMATEEGLELSGSGLESELAEGMEEGLTPSMAYGQFFNPLAQQGGYYPQAERGPGTMAMEEEIEDETAGGGTPESDIDRLRSFQAIQRRDTVAGEQLTGAPSSRLRNVKPEPPSTRQLVSQAGRGQAAGSGGPGKMDEIGFALKLLSNQVSSKLKADQATKQIEDFKAKIESLKRGKQAFKNLLDIGEIGSSESGVSLLTLWVEWNIDLINKHVADGKIPFFEQKPSAGSLPLEKTISNVKDGVIIFADILLPISAIAFMAIPLTVTALIVASFFGTFLQLANYFGISIL